MKDEGMTAIQLNQDVNPYMQGNFRPVQEEVTEFKLEVSGDIPKELNGRYLRNGPNPFAEVPNNHHWFIGAGMVHGIRLFDGEAKWYRNRYVCLLYTSDAADE